MAAVGRERRLPHLNLTLDLPDTSDCRLRRFPLPPLHPSTSISTEHRLSDFDKLAVLGHGNGGTVCKVRHRRSGAVYALKILQQSSASREIQILRRTDSPSVVRCHAVFPATAGDSALLLEFMDAGSLESVLLRRRRPFPEPALAGIAAQVLRGLSYLHSMNIVHRDIKPANLLANSAGEIKIADFGTGKITGRSLNSCASFVGTCAYMSPERFDPGAHGGSYDAYSADVWSLGLTLLELGVGHFPLLPPGQRPDWAALMCAICFGDSPAAPDSASGEFRDFIRCCLEKDSEKRWSVAQLLAHPFIAGRDRSESERAFKMLLADES